MTEINELNRVEAAAVFAAQAHNGQVRKTSKIPYLLHPMEVANIIASMTDEEDTIIAGLLHDTVEDCGVDPKEIREKFGPRVAALVQCETEDKLSDRPPTDTWLERKRESLIVLEHTPDIHVKILWLGDKLSNLRSLWREYRISGEKLWDKFHQKDPSMHKWYYTTIAKNISELADTDAYREFTGIIDRFFGRYPEPDENKVNK